MEPNRLGVILDTSVIVAAERRGRSVRLILDQVRAACGDLQACLSVVTIAELVHGAYRAQTEAVRQSRLLFIEELCRSVPVFPMTIAIARLVGRIEGEQAAKGVQLAFEDLVIGATALHLGYAVATLNVRHFGRIPGLPTVTI